MPGAQQPATPAVMGASSGVLTPGRRQSEEGARPPMPSGIPFRFISKCICNGRKDWLRSFKWPSDFMMLEVGLLSQSAWCCSVHPSTEASR